MEVAKVGVTVGMKVSGEGIICNIHWYQVQLGCRCKQVQLKQQANKKMKAQNPKLSQNSCARFRSEDLRVFIVI